MASPYTTVNVNAACRSASLLYCDPPGPSQRYTTPATDPAPWYDASVPESAEFCGLQVEEIVGLDEATANRSVTDSDLVGGSLGPMSFQARTITVTGWLRGSSYRGVDYGLRWLTEVLTSDGDGDGTILGTLFMLSDCPPIGENTPDPLDYVRTMYRVGLTDGPKVVDTHTTTAPKASLTAGERRSARDGAPMRKIQFTLVAETPWVFSDTDWIVYQERLTTGPYNYDYGQNCYDDCVDPGIWAPDCGPTFNPPAPFLGIDNCYCEPWETMRHCFSFQTSVEWNDLTAVIEIQAGLADVRNFRLVAFNNPTLAEGTVCPCHFEVEPGWRCQKPCASIAVSQMPPGSKLVIDSRVRSVTLTLAGGEQVSGLRYISSGIDGEPFSWFDIDWCSALCLVASVNSFAQNQDVTFSFGLANRYKSG